MPLSTVAAKPHAIARSAAGRQRASGAQPEHQPQQQPRRKLAGKPSGQRAAERAPAGAVAASRALAEQKPPALPTKAESVAAVVGRASAADIQVPSQPQLRGKAESTAAAITRGRPNTLDPAAPEFYPYSGTEAERLQIDLIVPRIYQTNWRGAEDLEQAKALGITHIVSAGEEFLTVRQEDYPLNQKGIQPMVRYHALSVNDDEAEEDKMRAVLGGAVAFIEEALRGSSESKVLIHCAAGISRSSTVTLAYLIKGQKMTLRRAFETLYASRRVCWPNDGFMRLLISLERENALHDGKASRRAFRPTIDLAEYVAWGEYDPGSYAAAKTVDRQR